MPSSTRDAITTAITAVRVPIGDAWLPGELGMPPGACGLVLFADGSHGNRHSAWNRAFACAFEREGLATLMIDLLTPEEKRIDQVTALYRFDLDRIARRVAKVIAWLTSPGGAVTKLPIGVFGARIAVAELAAGWFLTHRASSATPPRARASA